MSRDPAASPTPIRIHLDPQVALEARKAITLRPKETPQIDYHFTTAFLDLCRLIETLVLHEHIVISDVESPRTYNWAGHEVIAPFLEAGVVSVERHHWPAMEAALRRATEDSDKLAGKMAFTSEWVFNQFLRALTGGASYIAPTIGYWGYTLASLRRYEAREIDPGFAQFLGEINEQIRVLTGLSRPAQQGDLLVRSYEELRLESEKTLSLLKSYGRPVPIVIPPIAAIVLDSVRRPEAIGRVALDLRLELEPYRKRFTRFESSIRDDNETLGEALQAAQELQRAMRELTNPNEQSDLLAFSNWRGVSDVVKSATTGNPVEVGFALSKAVLDEPLKALDRHLRRRQVTYMALLKERFLKVQGYGRLIERVFGHSISDSSYNETFELVTLLNSDAEVAQDSSSGV